MKQLADIYKRAVGWVATPLVHSATQLFVRIVLASVFWRSGRTKVVEGTWLQISDATRFLFETDYAGVPLPPAIAAPLTTYAEHLFPTLLVLGLATRLSALGLLGMTLVIQLFVFPQAWWTMHALWIALCLTLIVKGPGDFSLDGFVHKLRFA